MDPGRSDARSVARRCAFRGARRKDRPGALVPRFFEMNSSDLKLEIGHVLFIDIVGYSKLLINEQSEQIRNLKEIVRATEQVRTAEAEGKLQRLPTGDGGALVFRICSLCSLISNFE